MALLKLKIPPDKNGYQATPGAQVVGTDLDGGAPRQRQDVIGAWAKIPVQWTTGAGGYEYLQAFHSLTGAKGLPLLADLILESPEVGERTCLFVPGSFGLASHAGATYVVRAELAVEPVPIADDLATTLVNAYVDGTTKSLGEGGVLDGALA